MREFPNPKALQDYVKIHDLVYQWEGTPSFNERFLQLSPDQCEVVTVTTTRGPKPRCLALQPANHVERSFESGVLHTICVS